MKKLIGMLACLTLACFTCVAAAQTVPSNECFSPGLVRLAQAVGSGEAVSVEAEFSVEDAFYARDLSVLESMLAGTTIRYDGGSGEQGMTDALSLLREGEMLFHAALTRADGQARLSLNGRLFDVSGWIPAEEEATPSEAEALVRSLDGTAILERVPLASVEAWLASLRAGDEIAFGWRVTEPFEIERTLSDDGTRLTRLDIEGVLEGEDGRSFTVEGFLRQPAGRAPKDTFELTLTCDEDNYIELSYSALRENEVTRRDREGETSVTTALKAAGRLDGYSLSSRLSVRMRNAWTVEEENLSEKITITATLTHQDKTPGRRMQRLNAVEAESRNVIRITTAQEQSEPLSLTDEATLSVTMDENDFLSGGMTLHASVGGPAPAPVSGDAQEATEQELAQAVRQAVETLSARLYAQLGEAAREKITDGL